MIRRRGQGRWEVGLELWILLAVGPVALMQPAIKVFGVSSPLLYVPMALGWNIGTPVAFALLAGLFKRAGRVGSRATP